MPHRIVTASVLLAVALALALPGRAPAGTLDQIKKSGEIRLGYRTDSLPLAFNDPSGQPSGYSVELCRRIAAAVKETLKLNDLKITYVPLTSEDRVEAITSNKADDAPWLGVSAGAFNVLNRENPSSIDNVQTSPAFDEVTAVYPPRRLQLGMRFEF